MSRFGRGWWFDLACWNGLSPAQQRRLIEVGNLPILYHPEGGKDACHNGAEVAIELDHDEAPGPRFYCLDCAIGYLAKTKFGAVPSELPREEQDQGRGA